ncbi:DivIVA domain-containing protein [Evansella caseinilytica]|uniref:DivIVA domain-containing protein n=1 Tax=Evansella caseinilytica TaxID=1503961 RepID=A0A1H3U7W2_9BACI|nr:cell division regulator GpsB [Evansella caseinilytica]SDZ58554.1 DivIVA domain-containing protein [Evansella caseinilytica]
MAQKRISRLTQKDILEKEFKAGLRGYSQDEVDQFLDVIIKDYDAFENRIDWLEKEVERLKKENAALAEHTKRQAPQPQPAGNTNYDILRRLSNLEKHVFGSKLHE